MFFHEKENLDLIKKLSVLIEEESDDKTKAIACHDLGEFARYFPYGRQYLERLGLKERIILLMGK